MTGSTPISAVFWDFGGVITSSPFEAFRRYEAERGLPTDTIRTINSTTPDTNAWARFERNEITAAEFDVAFADEARRLGHDIRGSDALQLLSGDIRPEMVEAIGRVSRAGLKTACLTNNVVHPSQPDTDPRSRAVTGVMDLFDAVIESSKVGCRKPEQRFYEIACDAIGVPASRCVFLDDLGINLKPAAAMGMTTIKVVSAHQALEELESVLAISLRS